MISSYVLAVCGSCSQLYVFSLSHSLSKNLSAFLDFFSAGNELYICSNADFFLPSNSAFISPFVNLPLLVFKRFKLLLKYSLLAFWASAIALRDMNFLINILSRSTSIGHCINFVIRSLSCWLNTAILLLCIIVSLPSSFIMKILLHCLKVLCVTLKTYSPSWTVSIYVVPCLAVGYLISSVLPLLNHAVTASAVASAVLVCVLSSALIPPRL